MIVRLLLLTAMASVAVYDLQAAQITYTLEGTASGCVFQSGFSCRPNGVTFTNADVILSLTTDTGLVPGSSDGLYFSTPRASVPGSPSPGTSFAGIFLAGFGSGIVTNTTFPLRVIDDSASAGIVGFRELNVSLWFFAHDNGFNGYNLQSPFGPHSGTAGVDTGIAMTTSLGFVQFSSVSPTATFTATLGRSGACNIPNLGAWSGPARVAGAQQVSPCGRPA